MAITLFNTTSNTDVTHHNAGSNSTSFTHDSGTVVKGLLVVNISWWNNAATATGADSVTYNGVALTKVTGSVASNTNYLTEQWYLVAPTSGLNFIAINYSGAADAIKVGAATFYGVSQTAPLNASVSATGTSATPTALITTTVANAYMISAVMRAGANAASSQTGTSIFNNSTGGVGGAAQYDSAPTAGVNSTSWTYPASGNAWAFSEMTIAPDVTFTGTKTQTSSSVIQGVYSPYTSIFSSACNTSADFTSTVVSSGTDTVTVGSTGNGWLGKSIRYNLSTDSTEVSARKALSSRADTFQNHLRIDSAATMSTSIDSSVLSLFTDTAFTDKQLDLRIIGATGGYTFRFVEPKNGYFTTVGTTVIPKGQFVKIVVKVTATGYVLYLNNQTTPEITVARSIYSVGINGVGYGKFYTTGFTGIMDIDNIIVSKAAVSVSSNAQKLLDSYYGYMQKYLALDGAIIRPIDTGAGQTAPDIVSEGQAYALKLAVQIGDQTTFNLIENWTYANLDRRNTTSGNTNVNVATNAYNLMAFRYNPSNADGKGANTIYDGNWASDADFDRLEALFWAHGRWGSSRFTVGSAAELLKPNYLQRALNIADDLRQYAFAYSGATGYYYLLADSFQLGNTSVNLAVDYYNLIALKQLITYDSRNASFWREALDGAHDIINKNATKVFTGQSTTANLISDWVYFNLNTGTISSSAAPYGPTDYAYNAFRLYSRLYEDYIATGSTRSLTNLQQPKSFFASQWTANSKIWATYLHDGTPSAAYESNIFTWAAFLTQYANDNANTTATAMLSSKIGLTNTYYQSPSGSYISNSPSSGQYSYFDQFWTLYNNLQYANSITNFSTTTTNTSGVGSPVGLLSAITIGSFVNSSRQLSNARITAVPTKTQPANARITKAVTSTINSIGRIVASTVKTQLANSRIVKAITKTQPANARINKQITSTQPANARIIKTPVNTQPANGRLTKTLTKTNTANARISKNLTSTKTANARIIETVTANQAAKARIIEIVNRTQTAIGRTSINGSSTRTAVSRIKNTSLTKTQPYSAHIQGFESTIQNGVARIQVVGGSYGSNSTTSVARITNAATKTQTAKAFLVSRVSKTQFTKARIVLNGALTQPARALIIKFPVKIQSARGSVVGVAQKLQTARGFITSNWTPIGLLVSLTRPPSFDNSKTQTANARIQTIGGYEQGSPIGLLLLFSTPTNITPYGIIQQIAKAVIANSRTKTQTANARLVNPITKTQVANARIRRNFGKIQNAVARIGFAATSTQSAKARLVRVVSTTQVANARIRKILTKTQTANARISSALAKTQLAKATISSVVNATQNAKARISKTNTATITAVSRITKTFSSTQTAKATIRNAVTSVQNANARIQIVGQAGTPLGLLVAITTQTSSIFGNKTQTANANITLTRSALQLASAAILNTTLKTQYANARITKVIPYVQNATARIAKFLIKDQPANARIIKPLTTTVTANARVVEVVSKQQGANGAILRADVSLVQPANGRIRINGQSTQNANGLIEKTFSVNQTANAKIQQLFATYNTATAAILTNAQAQQYASALINIVGADLQPANGTIVRVAFNTQTANASIAISVIRVWDGTSFVSKPLYVWVNGNWMPKPVKFWNGTYWQQSI